MQVVVWLYASTDLIFFSIFEDPSQPSTIDQRLTRDSQNDLVNALQALTISPESSELPVRPGWGKNGTQIQLRSNFFPVKFSGGLFEEYDVKITPAVSVKRVKKRIFELLDAHPDYQRYRVACAHDYSAKLYAAKKLPQPLSFELQYYEEDDGRGNRENRKTYALEIFHIQELHLGILNQYLEGDPSARNADVAPLLAAFNTVFAQHPMRNGVVVGRNRFFFKQDTFPLGGGLEAWKGFYSSVRPSFKQLQVNVNVATTAFYSEGNLANAMNEFRTATFGARMDSFVRGIRVQTTHLGHKKTVKKTSPHTAQSYKFNWDEGGSQVSVEEYFKRSQSYSIAATIERTDLHYRIWHQAALPRLSAG